MRRVVVAICALLPVRAFSQSPSCYATPASMTPPSWRAPARHALAAPASGLALVATVPLPGPANRFDYQSFDPASGRLYMNHMNAGTLVVFSAESGKVIAEVPGLPRATGVRAVPSRHQVYVSAAGAHEVAIIDDRTLFVTKRIGGIKFPDGIAYVPDAGKVFVSDETGNADAVIDATIGELRSKIELGGEAGNTQYDSVSHCILVAVQTRNQLVAIDPWTEKVVARYDLAGSSEPHGFAIDAEGRLAFVSSQGNAMLQVLDLRTMRVIGQVSVGGTPDVLAWDAAWRRLYVAAEGGVLSAFWLDGTALRPVGELRMPYAHTVAVDPRTHRVFVPLQNVDGKPVLRIYEPRP
jgi:DNA-binding beta-propeller fold protein YncE